MVLVSNRGPLTFRRDGEHIRASRGGGGLVSGLAPLVTDTDTVWFAAALTAEDEEMAKAGVIEHGGVRARTIAIDPAVRAAAYDTVCNSMLWFLHHGLHDLSRRPVVDRGFLDAWRAYRTYNDAFADVIVEEAPVGASVLVQDYHLALLGPRLTARRPDLVPIHFSHTPFAPPHLLRVLPHEVAVELLEGMAGHHRCGFHSTRWATDFRRCCEEIIGRTPTTFVAPLGPDLAGLRDAASSPECTAHLAALDGELGERRLILRVDRIELSKNLLRGFRAYDTMLADRPDLRGTVVFRALGYASREGLPEYLAYRAEAEALADVVNRRWGTSSWQPIELDIADDFPRSVAHLRRYDVLLVNPIRDGLNLVAVEGPAVNERDGTVVLSREAGIHDLLDGAARSVNPFDIDDQARALAEALDLDAATRTARAAELRRRAESRTAADWLADQLGEGHPPRD
ncbi:MAG: trehalose-6-phosphate synthase [Acidimicrobiales bacterium]